MNNRPQNPADDPRKKPDQFYHFHCDCGMWFAVPKVECESAAFSVRCPNYFYGKCNRVYAAKSIPILIEREARAWHAAHTLPTETAPAA